MPYNIGMRKGCVYIMQETTGNDVTRMCRNDKIMCAIFALNFAIIIIWSIALNLGAPAKNTERKTTNHSFVQTEKLQNSVESKEYSIVPLSDTIQEEIEQATMSLMAYEAETKQIAAISKQINFKELEKAALDAESLLSGVVANSVLECGKKIKELEAIIPETTEPATEAPVTTEPVTQEIATEPETEAIVEEIPYVEEPVYMEEYVEPVTEAPTTEAPATETPVTYSYTGPVLTAWLGTIQGPSGKETYYNLDMSGVISLMNSCGYNYTYWVRDDGCKMFGDYIMCAANLNVHPRGSLVETSLGTAIVCDTGGFAYINAYQIDIATTW